MSEAIGASGAPETANRTRLTPLAVMLLALLREDDMHPYEMKRLLTIRHDDRLVRITNGTLYHTVGRLADEGLVREIGVDREGNRPERTTYAITEAGEAAVIDWVRAQLAGTDNEPQFRVALSEAHNLSRADAVALLSHRRETLRATHAELAQGLTKARETDVPEQYLVEIERDVHLGAAELVWLDSLILRLERVEFPWASEDPARRATAHYLDQRKAARQ